MIIHEVPTDETLRSQLSNGSVDFPFEIYLDDIHKFRSKSIEWHWHQEVEFVLVLSGAVKCCSETVSYILYEGDGLFINSGAIHRFESEHGSLMATMVFQAELIAPVNSLIYSKYIDGILHSSISILPFQEDNPVVKPILDRIGILYESTKGKQFSVFSAVVQLWESLLEYASVIMQQPPPHEDMLLKARMNKMLQYIHDNYQSRVQLSSIANAANISVSEALRCFQRSIQTTPVRYLIDYRLNSAKLMLISTSDTVAAISSACGFENPSYFCRMFKRKYSITPKGVRMATINYYDT